MSVIALLSTVAGIFGSFLPELTDYFKKKREYEHEAKMLELKLQNAEKMAQLEAAAFEAEADANEGKYLLAHDSSLDGQGFIGALRASVRPVITYCFFITFVVIKIMAGYSAIQSGYDFAEVVPLIWDTDTKAMFGAVIGFWFGSRAITKLRQSQTANSISLPKKNFKYPTSFPSNVEDELK